LLGSSKVEVHLTGYYSPPDELAAGLPGDEDEDEEYEGEEEDDEENGMVRAGNSI
jgi:hypothetical protein